MNVLLIYNPFSGNKLFKNYLDYIISKFQKKGFQIIPYRMDQGLEQFISNINLNDYAKILVAGGDGTINQAVNVLVKHDIDLPIGIFPVGTANDYARYFNLPKTIEEITEILLRDNYTYSDIGCVNDKYFINVASLGFLIDISQRTDAKVKNSLGVLAYYLKGIEELPSMKPVYITVNSEEMNFEGEIYFMLIMNGKSAGGFKKIAPFSSINDGLFDIYIFKKCPLYELMPLLLKIHNGEHFNSPHVVYFQTSQLTVNCDEKIGTDIDGEVGTNFPLSISNMQGKLKIITRNNHEEGTIPDHTFSVYEVKNVVEKISTQMIHDIKKPELNIEHVSQNVVSLIRDMPKHNALNYVNKNSLSEAYFESARQTLDNGYLYIVLSSTGSTAGELIGKVTKKDYSHVSLAFDEELKTIVSYNGGENIYSPGLNQEMIEFFYKKKDANIIIYKLKANEDQKKIVLEQIENINKQGSSYNVLGLLLPYSHKDNIMFCSQFVYKMLQKVNLNYFDKKSEDVKPTDFVELDYQRNLKYHSTVFVKDMLR